MFRRITMMLLVACSTSLAADVKPSEESIKQLLTVTDAHKLLDNVMAQMDGYMKNAMEQATRGQPITPEQQKVIDRMQGKIQAMLKQELSWEKLEPVYYRIYSETFTQEEVDQMLAFYRTPGGQALIKKMPLVMQRTMIEMQKQMAPMIEKLQTLGKETVEEMKAASPKK